MKTLQRRRSFCIDMEHASSLRLLFVEGREEHKEKVSLHLPQEGLPF